MTDQLRVDIVHLLSQSDDIQCPGPDTCKVQFNDACKQFPH